MASLPWYCLWTEFPRHEKTLSLCSRLRDDNAGMYVIRLFSHCAERALDGLIKPEIVEGAAGWRKKRGALLEALIAVGTLEPREGGALYLHGWEERNGSRIRKAMADNAKPRGNRLRSRCGPDAVPRGTGAGSRGVDVRSETEEEETEATACSELAEAPASEPETRPTSAEAHHDPGAGAADVQQDQQNGAVAQRPEQPAFNRMAPGSTPGRPIAEPVGADRLRPGKHSTPELAPEADSGVHGLRPEASPEASSPRAGAAPTSARGAESPTLDPPRASTAPLAQPSPALELLPADPPPVSSVVAVLPCVGSGPHEYGVTAAQVADWAEAFPGVDVLGEVRKARVWLEASPKRRKTHGGMARFLVAWLTRAQDGRRAQASDPPSKPRVMADVSDFTNKSIRDWDPTTRKAQHGPANR